MKCVYKGINICSLTFFTYLAAFIPVSGNVFYYKNLTYWKFEIQQVCDCPNPGVSFYLYTSNLMKRVMVDVTDKWSLFKSGWNTSKSNVIIVHGFNGTESNKRMTILRNAYLVRDDFNVFMVDWSPLTTHPFYLSSLRNIQLVSKCAAQLYTHIINSGAAAYHIHCVGHSLGAHICGMISSHLPLRLHKIIGLDPARPLIDTFTTDEFRLTRDDANFVEIIHTSSGLYGQYPRTGHVDFSVNGGLMQPVCSSQPNIIQKARCSHFKSVCYFASSLSRRGNVFLGIPCTEKCDRLISPKSSKIIDLVPMGLQTPEWVRGSFYVPYDDPDEFCKFER